MSLSVREKILVFLLLISAIVFIGIKYLVTPAMQDAANDKTKLPGLFDQQLIVQQKVAAAKSADANLQKELATANSAASAILPQPDTELLNVWIVNLVQSSGLSVTTVSFSDAAVTDITPQNNTASNTQAGSTGGYLLKDYADSYKSNSPSNGASSQAAGSEGGLLCVNVTINMTGTYDQSKAFLDKVKNCGKTAIVNAFTCSVDNNKVYTISAVIACYGAEKLDDSDSTFAWTQPQPAGNNDLM